MNTAIPTIVELSGHIIDSLTLAKVIDLIQTKECPYQINDLQIGVKKTDPSYAQISIWVEDAAQKDALLAELKVYGAQPVGSKDVTVAACPKDGELPDGAYIRENPPMEIRMQGSWLAVEHEGADYVIVVDNNKAQFVPVSHVKQGQQVVIGTSGVKILPSM